MAVGSVLTTCPPPAHARDDPRTKARGPVPTAGSAAPAARGYLWLPGHGGVAAARGPSWAPSLLAPCPGSCRRGPWVLTPSAPKICPWKGAVGLPPLGHPDLAHGASRTSGLAQGGC